MIPKQPALHLMRVGTGFQKKLTLKQKPEADPGAGLPARESSIFR
jgi:hypothetical protein